MSATIIDSPKTKIKLIRGFNASYAKGLYIELENGFSGVSNLPSCNNITLIRSLSQDIADFDQQFSMLLAAFMAETDVYVQISGDDCSSGHLKFLNVVLVK